jgi:hypothetical protein
MRFMGKNLCPARGSWKDSFEVIKKGGIRDKAGVNGQLENLIPVP